MTNKLKNAFSDIRAEAKLKEQTKQYIMQHRTSNKRGSHHGYRPRLISLSLVIVLMLVVGGGIAAYFTPVAAISIDAESSIELQLNRFDRVVDFEQYGEGDNHSMPHMMHSNYTEAVEMLLANPVISATEAENSLVEITVASKDDAKVAQLMAQIETTADRQGHPIKMFMASSEEQRSAHQQGMSMGKHRMYQELLEQNPTIQPEEVIDYSMNDLHHMMKSRMSDRMPQNNNNNPKHPMNHH